MALERRAEAISGEFTPQAANTVWTDWQLERQVEAISQRRVPGGGDIRGVQLAGCCKHAVGVCDDGDKWSFHWSAVNGVD